MGVYLSEPNTAKNTKTGVFNKMAFYSVEMQGMSSLIEVGGRTWKMLLSIN